MSRSSTTHFVLLLIVLCVSFSGLYSQYAGGSGTESDPYQISTPAHLDNIRLNLDAYFLLINDIDMDISPYNVAPGFAPIGLYVDVDDPQNSPFTGTLDGGGFTVSNFLINRQNQNVIGLFAYANSANVKNLSFSNLLIWGGQWFTGGITAYDIGSVYENCLIAGTVAGYTMVGGFIGRSEQSTLSHCSFASTIWSTDGVCLGGLIGWALNASVDWCDSSGSIQGFGQIGGLLGESNSCTISNSYSLCNFCLSARAGGLIGQSCNDRQTLINSYYNYDQCLFYVTYLFASIPLITPGALPNAQFNEWLAGNRYLDTSGYLEQDNGVRLIQNLHDFQLLWAMGEDHSLSFRLTADIDLASVPGFNIPYFTGHFNGNGHSISNLHLTSDVPTQGGVFSLAETAYIENLYVHDCYLEGDSNLGGVCGNTSATTIKRCCSDGFIDGSVAGGITGFSQGGSLIDQCSSYVDFVSFVYLGGIAGINRSSDINRSFYCGSIDGYAEIGGLVAWNDFGARISNSYASGTITGDNKTTGLVYKNDPGSTVQDSYTFAFVDCLTESSGLAGITNPEDIHFSYWDIEATGQSQSAGGQGRTTQQMTYPFGSDTYTGWDFAGTWSYDPQGIVNNGYPTLNGTPVANSDLVVLPDVSLQNFPNPFNPSTTISFALPAAAEVELGIYNLRGQLVRTLVKGDLLSGKHSIVWDGTDSHGQPLGSGVYIYRLQNGKQVITNRMTLIK